MHSLTFFFILFDFSAPNEDNERSSELTQTSSVLARPRRIGMESQEAQSQSIICFTIFFSFKKWCLCWHCSHLQEHAPSNANTGDVLTNNSSTAHLEPFSGTEPAFGDWQFQQIQQIGPPLDLRRIHLPLPWRIRPPRLRRIWPPLLWIR